MNPATPDLNRRAEEREPPERSAATRSRLWLDFVNTDLSAQPPRGDLVRSFEALLSWLSLRGAIDEERAGGIARRAKLQPAAAAASLVDARRVRAALRALAERGATSSRIQEDAVVEINRVLGRSAGTRRIDRHANGSLVRAFVPTGDAFAGLMIPIVESAADSLVADELPRIRRCADPVCQRVFFDATRNGLRRWCDMGTCGNRAKAARHRAKSRLRPFPELPER
ncbi:MAG: CGNR zinc finger domain-containing protein [Phycisphaerae bacterium]|nr:CGNR zinc finger domain-containing protein [Gemmatimonadaceae bacterium]